MSTPAETETICRRVISALREEAHTVEEVAEVADLGLGTAEDVLKQLWVEGVVSRRSGRWGLTRTVTSPDPDPRALQGVVLSALQEHGSLTADEIAKRTARPRSRVQRALASLENAGKVHAKWTLP